MLSDNQIKQRLSDANLRRVAINAGLHPSTLYRFMKPDSKPRFETAQILSNYLLSKSIQAALVIEELSVVGVMAEKSAAGTVDESVDSSGVYAFGASGTKGVMTRARARFEEEAAIALRICAENAAMAVKYLARKAVKSV